MADAGSGLQAIRVADPVLPIVLAATLGPGLANDVAIAGDYAYLANHYFGLMVVDITDPTNPTSAGNQRTPDRGRGVAVAGDHAYVADTFSGLQVIDISDPTNPDSVGSYDTSGQALAVAIAGDLCLCGGLDFLPSDGYQRSDEPRLCGKLCHVRKSL